MLMLWFRLLVPEWQIRGNWSSFPGRSVLHHCSTGDFFGNGQLKI